MDAFIPSCLELEAAIIFKVLFLYIQTNLRTRSVGTPTREGDEGYLHRILGSRLLFRLLPLIAKRGLQESKALRVKVLDCCLRLMLRQLRN